MNFEIILALCRVRSEIILLSFWYCVPVILCFFRCHSCIFLILFLSQSDFFSNHFKVIQGSFWNHVGFILIFFSVLVLFRNYFEVILGLFRCHFRVVLMSFWDHFSFTLVIQGSFPKNVGVILIFFSVLALFRNYFEVILRLFRCHFRVVLGSY